MMWEMLNFATKLKEYLEGKDTEGIFSGGSCLLIVCNALNLTVCKLCIYCTRKE